MPRPKTWKLKFPPDRYGRSKTKTVNTRVSDIAVFKDCAGFAFLVMAANPHLSARDIQAVLESFGEHQWRSETWIESRRYMFLIDPTPLRPSVDGFDERAKAIVRNNPRISARKMVALLRSNGIIRPAHWVYRSRIG